MKIPPRTVNLLLPFITILLIYVAFFHHLERASYGEYTFSIHSFGRELVITSGPDQVNESVMIHNNVIQFKGQSYRYELSNIDNETMIEIYSNNKKIYTIVGFSSSSASFHSADRVSDSYPRSEPTDTPSSVDKVDNHELLAAALTVHLRVIHLNGALIKYIFIHAVLLFIGIWCYIKLTGVNTWKNKLKFRKQERIFSYIGVMVMSIPIIYAMFIFFLLG